MRYESNLSEIRVPRPADSHAEAGVEFLHAEPLKGIRLQQLIEALAINTSLDDGVLQLD